MQKKATIQRTCGFASLVIAGAKIINGFILRFENFQLPYLQSS